MVGRQRDQGAAGDRVRIHIRVGRHRTALKQFHDLPDGTKISAGRVHVEDDGAGSGLLGLPQPAPEDVDQRPFDLAFHGQHVDRPFSGLGTGQGRAVRDAEWLDRRHSAGCRPADVRGGSGFVHEGRWHFAGCRPADVRKGSGFVHEGRGHIVRACHSGPDGQSDEKSPRLFHASSIPLLPAHAPDTRKRWIRVDRTRGAPIQPD